MSNDTETKVRDNTPVFCRDCRGKGTFERNPVGDSTTETGKVFLACYKCRECGHIARVSNREGAI